ncbi:hypothetical protein B0H13DRAFT_1916331 [Mycena leptocephala]|nr:hypothetical protein B0H13DRAFT_1916331 [Mycena leptocephala]
MALSNTYTKSGDTTFKRVAGKANLYEIDRWMPSINKGISFFKPSPVLLISGTLLGTNADMEAAPLLGMADTFLPTIGIPSIVEEVKDSVGVLVKRNVCICYSHVKSLVDHKEMHEWLLPSVIQCLSDIDPDGWHVMEATTNFGKAQHVANNAQKKKENRNWDGAHRILRTARTTNSRYRRAAEIEIMLQNRNLHNPSKTVSDETIQLQPSPPLNTE